MMETLLPMDIVHHDEFADYWDRYLKQKNIVRHTRRNSNRNERNSSRSNSQSHQEDSDVEMVSEEEKAAEDTAESNIEKRLEYTTGSIWSVFSVHFYTMFMIIFGSHRLTRYVHALVFCAQYGFEMARSLKTSYRALYGTDGVERMNSATKTCNHTASSRFGGGTKDARRPPEDSLRQIILWILHNRYGCSEEGDRSNLHYRQKHSLLERQKENDQKKLSQPDGVRNKLMSMNVSLNLPCPVSNHYHTPGRYDKTDKSDDKLQIYTAELQTSDDQSDGNLLNFVAALEDNLCSMTQVQDEAVAAALSTEASNYNSDEHDSEEEDDYYYLESDVDSDEEVVERDCVVKYSNVMAVATPSESKVSAEEEKQLETFPADDDQEFIQIGMKWTPLSLHSKGTKIHFAKNWIRLKTGHQTNANNRVIDQYRLTWNYQDMRFILWHHEVFSCCFAFKMVSKPKVEIKDATVSSGWRELTDDIIPQCLHPIVKFGKWAIWFNPGSMEYAEMGRFMKRFHHFGPEHRIKKQRYRSLKNAFSLSEKSEATIYFRQSKNPLLGDHNILCNQIDDLMLKQRIGMKRKCLSCGDHYEWFERHSICFANDEEAENVAKHIFERLMYDNFNETDTCVNIIDDPLDLNSPTAAQVIVQEDFPLWTMYIMSVYLQMVEYLHEHKYIELMNCKNDPDWKQLCCPIQLLIPIFDRAMVTSLHEHSRNTSDCGDLSAFIRKMVIVLSDIFIIPKCIFGEMECSISELRSSSESQRQNIFNHSNFQARFKHHYIPEMICDQNLFIELVSSYWHEIMDSDWQWTFQNKLEH